MWKKKQMWTHIFIYNTVYQWADRKEEHTNGFKNGFQDPGASKAIFLQQKAWIKDVAAISLLFSIF